MNSSIHKCLSLFALLSLTGCYQALKAKPSTLSSTERIVNQTTSLNQQEQTQSSQTLKISGQAELGKEIPFFSGWAINSESGHAYSLRMTKEEGKSRYVLTVCASWCKPCLSGLKRLSEAKERFISTNTGLVILVADDNHFGRLLYENYGFDWAHVVVDEFKVSSFKLAPSAKNKSESLSLPRTFIFNPKGIVEKIIGIEGEDYIDALLELK